MGRSRLVSLWKGTTATELRSRLRWASRGVVDCRDSSGQGWILIRAFAPPRREGGREKESFAVRGPLDVSTKSNSAGSRLETRGKLEAGWQKRSSRAGGFAFKVRSWCGESVESACVARRCRGWSWSRTRRDEMEAAKKQRLRACRKLINECCLMGYSRAEFCSGGMGERRRDEKGRGCQMELRPNEERAPKTLDQGGERAGLVRY